MIEIIENLVVPRTGRKILGRAVGIVAGEKVPGLIQCKAEGDKLINRGPARRFFRDRPDADTGLIERVRIRRLAMGRQKEP